VSKFWSPKSSANRRHISSKPFAALNRRFKARVSQRADCHQVYRGHVRSSLLSYSRRLLSKTYTDIRGRWDNGGGRSEARHRNGLQILKIGQYAWRYPWIKGSNGHSPRLYQNTSLRPHHCKSDRDYKQVRSKLPPVFSYLAGRKTIVLSPIPLPSCKSHD
jgi:hypothetical protein